MISNACRVVSGHNLCSLCSIGVEHLSTFLKVYKVGDIVDIKVSHLKKSYFCHNNQCAV